MLKKILASFLSVIVLVSMTVACSSPDLKNDVISVVNEFSMNLCSQNIPKLLKTIEVRNEAETLLDTYINGKGVGNANKKAYDAILRTLSYEVDESSFTINKYQDDAFVEVTFSMVDYYPIIEDESNEYIDDVVKKLNSENKRIDTKISIRTYYDGNRWMVDNTKVILTELFDEVHRTVSNMNLSTNREISFLWLGNTDFSGGIKTITNTDTIAFAGKVDDLDPSEKFAYYYELYYGSELISISSLISCDDGLLAGQESAYEYDNLTTSSGVPFIDENLCLFLSGIYEVKLYDEYGILFFENSIECIFDPDNYNWIDSSEYSWHWIGTVDGYDTYINCCAISLEIDFEWIPVDLSFDSYYTVTIDGSVIYISDSESVLVEDGVIYYSFGKFFEECPVVENDTDYMFPGEYTISIYDSNTNELIIEDNCYVFYTANNEADLVYDFDGFTVTKTSDYFSVYFADQNNDAVYNSVYDPVLYYESDFINIIVTSMSSYKNTQEYFYEYYLDGEFVYSNSCPVSGLLNDTCYANYPNNVASGKYEVYVYNPIGDLVTIVAFSVN